MSIHRLPHLLALAGLAIIPGRAQVQPAEGSAQPVATQPGFDVASIKLSDPTSTGAEIGISPGGNFFAKGITVSALIENSYDVRRFQISGAPGWLTTERYDIVTKNDNTGVSEGDLPKMTTGEREVFWERLLVKVQALLADRFQLKLHRETRDLPVYALVVARTGSKLQVWKDGGAGGPSLSIRRDESGNTEVVGMRLPLSSLVRVLSRQAGRTVLDKTGLIDDYDFKMTYAPDLALQPELAAAGADSLSAGGSGPSLFTALQEQLGLRLDAQKGPVEILVIDSIERPSGN
jgi:bla regulator protein blaR1